MKENTVLIVVPGKTDRSFYSAMFTKLFKKVGIVNLDKKEYKRDKSELLSKIFTPKDGSPMKGSSVIKIVGNESTNTNIVIWPAINSDVPKSTADVLSYQAGLMEPTVDIIVAAEDSEDRDFRVRLDSLYMSIFNNCSECEFTEIERGDTYGIYTVKTENWSRDVTLMLLVQGLQTCPTNKHAIEDFAIRPIFKEDELREVCSGLMDKILADSNAHKKLALLIAINKCVTNLEKVFHNILDEDDYKLLIDEHDGLRKLINICFEI